MTENNGTPMFMPVAPAYGGGNGGGFGFGDGNGWWVIFLLIVLGGWGNGFGGFGGGNGAVPYMMNNTTNSDVQRGFDQSAIISGLTGIQGAVTSGFGDMQTALCGGFAGVNAGIANGFAQAEIAANARQIASMQNDFAGQTAMLTGFNGIQNSLSQCLKKICNKAKQIFDFTNNEAVGTCAA